jgi:CheY-like chemotaxis protein
MHFKATNDLNVNLSKLEKKLSPDSSIYGTTQLGVSPKKPNSNKEVVVLIVDDNGSNIFVLKAMLARFKVKCDTANNGLEAIQLITQKGLCNYRLVLMDINMPIMNGVDATIKIKELEALGQIPEIPVIAVSAQEEDRVKKAAFEAGVVEYIEKPISISKIENFVKIYCQ